MAISNFDRKMEILGFMVFLYGKLITLAVTVERAGEDSTDVRAREKKASEVIDDLRSDMFRKWNGQADQVMADLRAVNENAQRKVRDLESAVDKTGKVADILGVIDRAISLASGL
jgi:hypothetical protein